MDKNFRLRHSRTPPDAADGANPSSGVDWRQILLGLRLIVGYRAFLENLVKIETAGPDQTNGYDRPETRETKIQEVRSAETKNATTNARNTTTMVGENRVVS
jgi:hypothetical protein